MEKEKSELEQLLNSLVEAGWKPRGWNIKKILYLGKGQMLFIKPNVGELPTRLRFITTKESGLWQFVCENGMVEHKGIDIHSWEHTTAEHSDFWFTDGDNYEYYIIESSLKDESELEDFLLSNIVIKENENGTR